MWPQAFFLWADPENYDDAVPLSIQARVVLEARSELI